MLKLIDSIEFGHCHEQTQPKNLAQRTQGLTKPKIWFDQFTNHSLSYSAHAKRDIQETKLKDQAEQPKNKRKKKHNTMSSTEHTGRCF